MKFTIVLYLVVLFLMALELQAQPGCRGKFSPYNICQSDYTQADYIFYGEVTSSGETDHNIAINGRTAFYRTAIKVEKVLKGEPASKMEIYLDYEIVCDDTPVPHSKHIFNVKKTNLNGRQVYYSQYISRPLADYSSQALKEVFSGIQAVLEKKKKKSLDGYVLEYLTIARDVNEKREESDRYLLSARSFNPQRDILVEAVNEQTNKIYRTKSNAEGAYRFDNLPNGNYKLQAYLSDGKEGEILNITVDDSRCTRWRNVFVRPKSE